jgi:hypothetical protein
MAETVPKTLDPADLDFQPLSTGARATAIGEDGDVLILGHLDDDAAWATFVAWRTYYDGDTPDDGDRPYYDINRRHASFSDHSEGCELVDCACDEQACDPCRAGNHDGCSDADYCECAAGYDHEFEGAWPCNCECHCDEYAWWVSATKPGTGHPVTWVSYSYAKAKALADTK